MTLEVVVERFIRAASEGIALNKWRRPYRPRAVEDLESLNRLPRELLGCHIDAVTLGDVQGVIDELSEEGRSASRISSIVNALRALYRFARERAHFQRPGSGRQVAARASDRSPSGCSSCRVPPSAQSAVGANA
jgi:site-specific recombinase XerD